MPHSEATRTAGGVSPAGLGVACDEVVRFCSDLIRIDTTNAGDGRGPGERAAAEYVAGLLDEVGLAPRVLESAPGRASVVARWEGSDPSRDAMLVHGHLDVVPAEHTEWTVHPFSGELADGCVWGRGAVDMKNADAMVLAAVRAWAREGLRPPRDVVLAFVADEESTGEYGAGHLVREHPDLFAGCTEAISESGAFSYTVDGGRRLYPIATGERGTAWMRLVATGTAGHGSKVSRDNAVTRLAAALHRIGEHEFPLRLTPTVAALLEAAGRVLGVPIDTGDLPGTLARLGGAGRLVEATLRNTANPTMVEAGYKVNVIPGTATAHVDGRMLPGYEEEFLDTIDRLAGPGIAREFVSHEHALEAPFHGRTVEAMVGALCAEDPEGHPIPYCMSGGTDAKWFARLGIAGYGFSPLRLPPDLDYFGMFHGVDERVPVEGLRFGVRVLDRFLGAC